MANDAHALILSRTSTMLEYLSAVAREIGPEPLRDVTRQDFLITPGSVPQHSAVTVGPNESNESWLTVKKVTKPAPPKLPAPLDKLVDPLSLDTHKTEPEMVPHLLKEWVAAELELQRNDLIIQLEGEIGRELDEQPEQRFPNNEFGRVETRAPQLGDSAHQATRVRALDAEVHKRLPRLLERTERALTEQLQSQLHLWKSSTWQSWASQNASIFDTRALYSRLFELHLRLESEKATTEAIWGHAVLSWSSGQGKTVRAPLVTVSVNIEVDQHSGAITVSPDGAPTIDLSAIEGVELSGVEHLARLQGEFLQSPVDVWSQEERDALRAQLIAPLGLSARIVEDTEIVAPTSDPLLNDGWVLIDKPRPLRQEAFYDLLSKQILNTEEAPSALAAIVTDNDTVDRALTASGNTAVHDDGTAHRLLMPLPANEDQERIARQLATGRGVTVQGPPGTGKSHTIVNLVSHLVAQGKRVLVTAENEQALSVIRQKIPIELRDLSIAVLGSTPAALDELRNSAQSMRDSLSQVDQRRDSAKLQELGTEIDQAREKARRIDRALVEVLSSEQRELELGGEQLRAPEVAAWLSDRLNLAVIPDNLTTEQNLPITADELQELRHLARSISPADAEHALRDLPVADWLWTTTELEAFANSEHEAESEVGILKEEGLKYEELLGLAKHEIESLIDQCTQRQQVFAEIDGDWEQRLVPEIRSESAVATWVLNRLPEIDAALDELENISRNIMGSEVTVPTEDPQIIIPKLHAIRERFEAGKKLPLMGGKELKEVLGQITVNGYVPTQASGVNLAIWKVHEGQQVHAVSRLQKEVYEAVGANIPAQGSMFALASRDLQKRFYKLFEFWGEGATLLNTRLSQLTDLIKPVHSEPTLHKAQRLLQRGAEALRIEELRERHSEQQSRVKEMGSREGSSELWSVLGQALADRDVERWSRTELEARRILGLRERVIRKEELAQRVREAGAPLWVRKILGDPDNPTEDLDEVTLRDVWRISQSRTWIESLHAESDVKSLMQQSLEINSSIERALLSFASISARLSLSERMKDRERRALETWLTAIRRVGKGTGKNAPIYQAQARAALPAAMGAVPVWIMPIYRVMENFNPTESSKFDVVIVDESSQCDLLSLGVLALGEKVVVVGDDKQTSPVRVGVKTDRIHELQNQYVSDFPDKALLTLDESLYAISARAFPSTILLREHFRCVPDIIRFSNRFYGGQILPLREITMPQIGAPLRVIHVPEGVSLKRGSSRVNHKEAERLVEEVARCAADPAYDGLTFGVVCMMSGPQKDVLESLLMQRLGIDEFEKRHLRVGNPPNFQGDERNVIFLSFVADDNSFAATREMHAQWANVAASRAQDQLWLFHSMDPSTLNANDLRRAMIEYASAPQDSEREDIASLTESQFEADVLTQLLDRGYSVTPQHQVGAYRIDMVVNLSGNERLGIECDGDRFHGPEHWESDVRRQRVLERLGWKFWRVRASAYYLDPVQSLEPLWQRLRELEAYGAQRDELRVQQQLLAARATQQEHQISEELAGNGAAEEQNSRVARSEAHLPVANLSVGEPLNTKPVPASGPAPKDRGSLIASETADDAVEPQQVRAWAARIGMVLGDRGRIPQHVIKSYIEAHGSPSDERDENRTTTKADSSHSSESEESRHTLTLGLERDFSELLEQPQPADLISEVTPAPEKLSAEGEEFRAASIAAWRTGDVYQYSVDGSVAHGQTGLAITEWMSPVNYGRLRVLLRKSIPAGGVFKLGTDGTVVIRIEKSVVRLGQIDIF